MRSDSILPGGYTLGSAHSSQKVEIGLLSDVTMIRRHQADESLSTHLQKVFLDDGSHYMERQIDCI